MFDIRKLLLFAVIPLIIILNFYLLFSSYFRAGRLERNILRHTDIQREEIENIKEILIKSTDDINQTRSLLNLPVRNYSFDIKSETQQRINDSGEFRDNLLYYQAFESLLLNYKNIKQTHMLSDFISDSRVQKLFEQNNLSAEEQNTAVILKYRTKAAYKISTLFKDENPEIIISIFDGKEQAEISPDTIEKYINATFSSLKKRIDFNLDEIRVLNNIIGNNALKNQLLSKKLYLSVPEKNKDEFITNIYNLTRNSGEAVAKISFNDKSGQSKLNELIYESAAALISDLSKIEEIADLRTSAEKNIEKAFNSINNVLSDPSFSSYMNDKGYMLESMPREGADYYYFDLISVSGDDKIGSFGVHKHTGDIYLLDFENVMLSSLSLVNEAAKKKILMKSN